MPGKNRGGETEGYQGNPQGKYTEGVDRRRGLAEFSDFVGTHEVDNVSPEQLEEAAKLLAEAARLVNGRYISEADISAALEALIENTFFADAQINRVLEVFDAQKYMDLQGKKTTSQLLGDYNAACEGRGGCYNVHFRWSDGQWFLDYSPVQHGGNLRQAQKTHTALE